MNLFYCKLQQEESCKMEKSRHGVLDTMRRRHICTLWLPSLGTTVETWGQKLIPRKKEGDRDATS